MTRFLFWAGWGAAGFALLAVFVVVHAVMHPLRYQPMPLAGLHSGATFVSLASGGTAHLVVTSIQAGGAGEVAGLRVGDRIEDVDGLPAPTIKAFNMDIAGSAYDEVVLRIRRGSAFLDIHMAHPPGR